MNAFDATKAGSGETGLASLFATATKPANGLAAGSSTQDATPFAQLLDQLNALPMPQAGGASMTDAAGPTSPTLPPPLASSTLALPSAQQAGQPVGEAARMPLRAEPAPLAASARASALRVPVIGKMLPPVADTGTNLPVVTGQTGELAAGLPLPLKTLDAAGESVALPLPVAVAQPVVAALHTTPAMTSFLPMRSAATGQVRAARGGAIDPAASSAAAPAATATPAAPAIALTAADMPTPVGGDLPAASEHMPGEAAVAPAPVRPAMPASVDLHDVAHIPEPMVAAPSARAEPQQMAMQDLTQIVERLAAAREAAAPAATQLAVDHAEFGPLSLSIQQGDRGELAIAVAAADRDSQAALVAAIGQSEAPAFEQAPERRGSESAQRDLASTGQHSEQRGQNGQRDRFAGQQHRQTPSQREPGRERDGETRSGTYA